VFQCGSGTSGKHLGCRSVVRAAGRRMFACCGATEGGEAEVVPALNTSASPVLKVAHAEALEADSPSAHSTRNTTRTCASDFEARLSRHATTERWGMTVEVLPNIGVFITSVQANGTGAVPAYNIAASGGKEILQNDRVMSANGAQSAAEISREFRTATQLVLVMRRPLVFDETVDTKGKSLGLTLHHLETGSGLYVQAIAPDSIVAETKADLSVGDRIVRVNGRSGQSKEMLGELRATDTPVLTIARA